MYLPFGWNGGKLIVTGFVGFADWCFLTELLGVLTGFRQYRTEFVGPAVWLVVVLVPAGQGYGRRRYGVRLRDR